MGSDSIMKGSVPVCPKESGKKKRTNRLAKLKQEKLDARREQWLSQAKNKGFSGGNGNKGSVPVSLPPKGARGSRKLEMKSTRDENVVEFMMDCGGVDGVSGGNDTRKERPGSSSGSCSSSSGCFSVTISEEEEEEEEEEERGEVDDDGCLDDWETMADALIADEKEKAPKSDPLAAKEISAELASTVLNPEAKPRAWRRDDAYRPQSLPNITKQLSLPMNSGRHCRRGGVNWPCRIITSQPSSCPICYEDLDLTDSSFLPCSCGFHLCLFCHKRILEDDARCPGCRKQYSDPLNTDIGVGGGAPFIRFARSCSMNTRS